jgi:hypothetical protein
MNSSTPSPSEKSAEWTEAGNYPTPIAAAVAKAKLEAHGIESALFDAELANSWVYTNALGGVRLMVATDQLEAARDVLAADESLSDADAARAVSDQEDIFGADPDSWCPDCHSKEVEVRKEAPRGWLMRWLNPGRALHCRACGHLWRS